MPSDASASLVTTTVLVMETTASSLGGGADVPAISIGAFLSDRVRTLVGVTTARVERNSGNLPY